MPDTLSVTAPAKVNLALSVGPLDKARGMHPICSWMVTVDFCDELELTRLESGRLSRYAVLWHDEAPIKTDIDWSIQDDLAVRAHLLLEQHIGRALPVQLTLRKRIPIGGGLGGGSSNAAAMLSACCALFDLHEEVSRAQMLELAAALGSDVPFLLGGGSAIVEGTGESLEHFDHLPDLHIVLIFAQATCHTPSIYAQFDKATPSQLRPDAVRSLAAGVGEPFNDLAGAATALTPELQEHIEAIGKQCQCNVHITGSGSSMFIICGSSGQAQSTAATITEQLDVHAVAVEPTRYTLSSETTSP